MLQILNIGAQRLETVDQISYRPLLHSGLTRKNKLTVPQGQRGAQGPHRGAGITEKQLLQLVTVDCAAKALHAAAALVFGKLKLHAELFQRCQHVANII